MSLQEHFSRLDNDYLLHLIQANTNKADVYREVADSLSMVVDELTQEAQRRGIL